MRRLRPRTMLRRSLLIAVGLVVVAATPALADPAKPTNYRSTVLRLSPSTSAVTARVVGGDGYLYLKVERGHEAVVPSTTANAPPYLRFEKDGTVRENQLSPNTFINNSRYGGTAVPSDASKATATTPPVWKTVSTDGSYAWHDHRIHWMVPGTPPQLGGRSTGKVSMGGPNGDWQVPLLVDGRPVTVYGELVLNGAQSPLPWVALAVVAAVPLFFAGRRRPVAAGVGAALVAGLVALVVGMAQNAAIPAGAGAMAVTVALPAVAVVAAVVGSILRPPPTKVIGGLAAVAALLGWVATRFAVFTKSVLPTDLNFNLDRAGTAVVIGLSVAAAALLVRSGALTPAAPPASTPAPGSAP